MAEKLTDQQQLAVDDHGGALLVSAAAGSGKTKVLVERMLKLVTDPVSPVNIDDFLIITYTKAAAAELRSKIAKALTQRIAEDPSNMHLQQQFQRLYLAKISTVHAFCSDVLREYAYLLDIPADFRMIESKEDMPLRMQVLDKLLAECYDDLGSDADFLKFVDTQGVGRDDSRVPELILKVYDSAKCHMNSDAWLQRCVDDAFVENISDAGQTVWGKFLMEDIAQQAEYYFSTVENVASLCRGSAGLEKIAAALEGISGQLAKIRDAKSWDEIHAIGDLDLGDIKGVANKKNLDKDLYSQASLVRDACKKNINPLLKRFSNPSAQVLADLNEVAPAVRGLVSLVRKFGERYAKLKRGLRVMDFSDLEHKALDLFVGKRRAGPTEVARQVGMRFCQIMVDEYQDSNEVQDAIFAALTHEKQNLFMVGDVKQSIYQFRLADPRIFLDKYNRFAFAGKAAEGEGRKIVLSNNFRSSAAVIDGVNDVFRQCMSKQVGDLDYGDEEALWEGVPHEVLDEPAVELHVIDTDDESYLQEAEFVAERIKTLLDGSHFVRGDDGLRPIRPDDIAILLRAPKTNGQYFHDALAKRGYHTVSSVNVDLLATDEVQWVRSMLQTINNPRQDIPLIAALTGPVFGVSADELASVRISNRSVFFYDAMLESSLEKIQGFLAVLDRLRTIARMHTLPQLIESIFRMTQADAVYSAMEDGEIRSGNLQDFYQFVVGFSKTPGVDVAQLLSYLDQSDAEGLRVERGGAASGCIQITSIHKSKGLEYPVVFLCGLSKAFNLMDLHEKLLCDDELGLGLSCVDHNTRIRYPSVAQSAISAKMLRDTVSEELRVLYVGMTRPKDRLIMTYACKNADKDLTDLAVLMDHAPGLLLTSSAKCMGDWVLYTAMSRSDAGALFVRSRFPSVRREVKDRWQIAYQRGFATEEKEAFVIRMEDHSIPTKDIIRLRDALGFTYEHMAATMVPSKQTATQKKGRLKDQEVSENAPSVRSRGRSWREPSFGRSAADGRTKGNATHGFMQYVSFAECVDEAGIKREVERLIACGFLSREQAAFIDTAAIYRFFQTPLGQRLLTEKQVLREFKFSILDDASDYADDVLDEKILLQGVVDCALLDEDGITVVDFKTDNVTEETVSQAAQRYRDQVETYAYALSRIFEMPVKEKLLYFFRIGQFVTLP